MSVRFKDIFNTLRKNQNKSHRDDHEKTCDGLFQIFQSVYDLDEKALYITKKQAKSLGIKIDEMALVDCDGEYTLRRREGSFRPLSIETLNACPLDENDEDAKELSQRVRGWSNMASYLEDNRCTVCDTLGSELDQLANTSRRVGAGENARSSKLLKLNTWRPSGGLCDDIVHSYYAGMLKFNVGVTQYFFVQASYLSAYRREYEPHVSIILDHYYQGREDISHAELSTILAAMVTQMEHNKLQSHSITPFLLISFMDSFHGRILQAHTTNDGLVIQKSRLCSFRTQQEFDKSMSLFLRWMASERVGNTHQQVQLDPSKGEPADVKAIRKAMKGFFITTPADGRTGDVPTQPPSSYLQAVQVTR
ncbi:hypothetical protein NFIA_002260 [Paecilomyces variotii No. 5]|uniref:Uncharacterized protein n=1 Tax=Byssochlamys spectabilis (strain No. 5 / NBRC 109023) TaxID=1356009 RepID=V5FNF4_BYSSN|nr:hypothetical protein NFIA_002260 [Paecilomyces variotii No. 5]